MNICAYCNQLTDNHLVGDKYACEACLAERTPSKDVERRVTREFDMNYIKRRVAEMKKDNVNN
jgi:hypothetical protein